jgi:hypothetical protein
VSEAKEERLEEREGEDTSEGEVKVKNSSQGRATISISISSTVSGQSGGHSTRSSMVNQDLTHRLLVFHGMRRDNVEKHWFVCEANFFHEVSHGKRSQDCAAGDHLERQSYDVVYEVQVYYANSTSKVPERDKEIST